MTAVQRIRQGVRVLFAFTNEVDCKLAESYLDAGQMQLFEQMQRSEQLHSLNVLRAILDQGPAPHDLAVAALLHDVGKIRYPLDLGQKTLAVLTREGAPALYHRLSAYDPRNWFYCTFVVAEKHPAWGAEIVAKTHTTERVRWLVAHHADPLYWWRGHPHHDLLKRLQAADDAN